MIKINNTKLRISFYISWLVFMFIQAHCFDIIDDEAYYWVYSKYLAWGYFDHPPVIAMLIKLGYSLSHSVLGVRLFPILLFTSTIYLIERIIIPKKLWLYYLIISSICITHFLGFLAIPDIPLLFFSALLFYFYKKFTLNPSYTYGSLMGLAGGIMLISKYHGFIILLIILVSNLKLLKRKEIWLSIFIITLICLPHLIWNIKNDFPALNYHLKDRHSNHYDIRVLFEYITSQIFLLGPITSLFIHFSAFKFKPHNIFEKTLKYTYWSVLLLFLIISMKSRVEAHWTLLIIIPGVYMAYNYFVHKLNKTFICLLCIGLGLSFILKLYTVYDFIPNSSAFVEIKKRFHNNKSRVDLIKKIVKGKHVLFANNYQFASIYNFYNDTILGSSIRVSDGRKNQYDLLTIKEDLRGEDVFYFPDLDFLFGGVNSKKETYYIIENYQPYEKIKINEVSPLKKVKDSIFEATISLESCYSKRILSDIFSSNNPTYIEVKLFKQGFNVYTSDYTISITEQSFYSPQKIRLIFPKKIRGDYTYSYSIRKPYLPGSKASPSYKIHL